MSMTQRGGGTDPLVERLEKELCIVYKRLLTSESSLIVALKRIAELEAELEAFKQANADKNDELERLRRQTEDLLRAGKAELPSPFNEIESPQTLNVPAAITSNHEDAVAVRQPPAPVPEPNNENAFEGSDAFQVSVRSMKHKHVGLKVPTSQSNVQQAPTTPQPIKVTVVHKHQPTSRTPHVSEVPKPLFTATPPAFVARPSHYSSYAHNGAFTPGSTSVTNHHARSPERRGLDFGSYSVPVKSSLHSSKMDKRPPFIPGGEGTPFNAYSLRQMRDRERMEEMVLHRHSGHRSVVQQPARIYKLDLE